MTYPITVLLNKTTDDIYKFVEDIAKQRNIPDDLLVFAVDSVKSKIQDKAIVSLSNMNIETLNTLDEVSKKIPEEPEKVEGEVVS